MRNYRVITLAALNIGALLLLTGVGWIRDLRTFSSVAPDILGTSRQLVLVIGRSWGSDSGELRTFERDQAGQRWIQAGEAVTVALGRKGFAWGRGLHPGGLPGPEIDEGDYRTPTGIFALSSAFGQLPREKFPQLSLPYHQLTGHDYCVDDPNSRFYNRIVSSAEVTADWRSAEPMNGRRSGYEAGIVYDQNTNPHLPRKGSCFFLHPGPEKGGTAGCTTMSRENFYRIMNWLDPAKNPILVQLPRAVAAQVEWSLPAILP